MKQFCSETNCVWGGGIGLGTNGMVKEIDKCPEKVPIRAPVVAGFKKLAVAIATDGLLNEIILTQYMYPWFLYKLQAEIGWRTAAKSNGLTMRDLGARPFEKR